MAVRVEDLIGLKLFESARVVAGAKGIRNEIKRVNFSDCPIIDDEIDLEIVMKGDFFINSLYIVKDDLSEMIKLFQFYLDSGSAGVCIIDEFIKELPKEIVEMADHHNFPVIFIDTNVPYGEIIRVTTEMILLEKIDIISEMRIDKLLNESIDEEEVLSLAMRINGVFQNKYVAVYISSQDINQKNISFIRNELASNYEFEALKYRNNILMIINFNKPVMLTPYIDYIKKVVEKYGKSYAIGVSNIFERRQEFHHCIRQAFSTQELSSVIGESILFYKDLNIYQLIYPIKETRHLKDFYEAVITPLKEYDDYYKSNLLDTVDKYIELDGDYKATARFFNQHENSVRYRILKAKKLLDMENSHFKFIEHVSIGLKIEKLRLMK